jgi:hypothetical protein
MYHDPLLLVLLSAMERESLWSVDRSVAFDDFLRLPWSAGRLGIPQSAAYILHTPE